jgi:hypothetical protein
MTKLYWGIGGSLLLMLYIAIRSSSRNEETTGVAERFSPSNRIRGTNKRLSRTNPPSVAIDLVDPFDE